MITVDCNDLVSDFNSRLNSGENLELLFADLECGILAEVDEFLKKLIWILKRSFTEVIMEDTTESGLSTNSLPTTIPNHTNAK